MSALGLVAALVGGTTGWLLAPRLLPSPLARRARRLGRRPARASRDWRALADSSANRLAALLPAAVARAARAEADAAGWPASAAPRKAFRSLLQVAVRDQEVGTIKTTLERGGADASLSFYPGANSNLASPASWLCSAQAVGLEA